MLHVAHQTGSYNHGFTSPCHIVQIKVYQTSKFVPLCSYSFTLLFRARAICSFLPVSLGRKKVKEKKALRSSSYKRHLLV
jgi:hypothetical protein